MFGCDMTLDGSSFENILQAEEAKKLRKRKKAEAQRLLDMEKRQKQRLQEVRESQRKVSCCVAPV